MAKGKRLLAGALTALLLVSCISGCVKESGDGTGNDKSKADKIQIGMCFDSFVIERWQRDRDVFVSMAKELGADVNVQNANGDIAEQKKQIDYFIKKGMDAIVIVCIDSASLKDSVKKAKEAGIVVVAYDRLIFDADVDLYVSFDNEKVGELMGQAMVDNGLVDGDVLMFCGSTSDNNVPLVKKGFESVMKINRNNILDTVYAEGWKAEVASNYIYNNMETVEEADAIMCGNDDIASNVVRALSEKRLAGKIMVAGQDADLEACQRIVEGTQLMTVYKPIEKLAQEAAECTISLVKGEPISGHVMAEIDDGSNKVPFLKVEPISVTQKNIDEVIIKSGFHLKEDVYLNVPEKMPK
ncbi:MAG: substrate-binding domain-containing protein [Butyrivibrio sp.]|nr:substrate-binding domain-containing protein [Butyrivibrio sp.]